MDTTSNFLGHLGDLQKKIVLGTAILIVLMVLFPPKAVVTNLLGQSSSQSVGYHFILSDPSKANLPADMPTTAQDAMNQIASSHIEWGKLLLQIVGVVVLAGVLVRFVVPQQQGATGGSA